MNTCNKYHTYVHIMHAYMYLCMIFIAFISYTHKYMHIHVHTYIPMHAHIFMYIIDNKSSKSVKLIIKQLQLVFE